MDRRQPHRNSDVARAVRKTRDRLAQQAGNPDFHREMLKLHAHSMLSGAFFIPALIVLVFISGLAAGMGTEMLLWSALALACLSPLLILSRRYNATDASLIDPKAATRNYLIAHVIAGLGWAFFGLMGCTTCMVDQFHVVKAVTLLLAMAATAILTASLSGALIATFALPVLAYAWGATWPASPVEMMMLALLIIALPFLSYVANHLKHSSVMMLSFRSQKDALIAELETAKAMSDEARHRAEEANLAKSRFLASMSHELRTPLNAILGFSEVMANEVLGPVGNKNYREYAGDIHDSGQHLLNLINEILDLSRIEAGRYQLQEEAVILPVLAEDACHMMELRARNKGIRIVQQFEPTLPRLYADERAIRQILLNLLSNAIKFTSSGGEIRVRVGWTAGGGQYISVKDNGTGIPQDEIPVVLSAFGQGTIAIKSAEQGTGLGLPIVQGLIAMHGGEFELHSRLREGTEAIAIFPPSRVMEELPAMPTKVAANAGW